MSNDKILERIDVLITDYTKLMYEAMESNDSNKVYQFNGSCIALEILKQMIDES